MKKLGQKPAFPSEFEGTEKDFTGMPVIVSRKHYGMSTRFYAACCAMQGLLANPSNELLRLNADEIATMSLAHADELLKEYDNE